MSDSPDDGPALVLDGVSRTFTEGKRTIHALREVSLEVPRGKVTGLIGPDGAGKTTLMRLAVCLLAPDAGSISVLGIDALKKPLAVQATVGYMPQRFGLYEDLSVRENLDLYADLQGVPKSDRPERYKELMRMTGLGDFTDRLAGRLSGGMKQKLGLACTLVRAPELLILDEPTVGVDPVSRRELWSIVARLVEERGMSVLLSTAYLDEAEKCDGVILLHEGNILGRGKPEKFREEQRGRAFMVDAPGLKKREIQERLRRAKGVVDAVIQGEQVRLVVDEGIEPDAESLLPDVEDVAIEPVEPRFEDSYVARLRAETGGLEPPDPEEIADAEGAGGPEDEDNEPVISVENVRRRFGDFYAVKDVTFDVAAGEIFGLLGANGAGKTTTFRMLCGLLPVSDGKVAVAGLDLRKAAAQARGRIGYMSQKFSLYGTLSVAENMEFFASAYGLSGRRKRDRIRWAMDQFDLTDRADAASGQLPLGYKQRLALACALMHEPEILFLDEPTSGVDPMARREFWSHINALAAAGVTVLVTTHFMEEAEYCDRLVIMVAGEILAMGTPRKIRERAGSDDKPAESMEDAFIRLVESDEAQDAEAA
ncbi:MAG: ATP-binding cassette domain-containing protein [Thermodesulfobacteriota bacterium]